MLIKKRQNFQMKFWGHRKFLILCFSILAIYLTNCNQPNALFPIIQKASLFLGYFRPLDVFVLGVAFEVLAYHFKKTAPINI